MSINVVPNSTSLWISGVITMTGAVAAAVWWQAFWPLVFVLIGLAMAFRLERDATAAMQAVLTKRGVLFHKVEKNFYAWFGSQLVHGPYDRKHMAAFEELINGSSDPLIDELTALTKPTQLVTKSSAPKTGMLRVWPLSSIQSITFTTGQQTFTLHTDEKNSEHGFKDASFRDAALKFIKQRGTWRETKEFRTIFKLNILAILASLLVMFFCMALAFTAIGIVQPNQLPLATWADLKNVRGKAAGAMFIWVCLCEAYMFLVNMNLPPALKVVLGVVASFVLGAIMVRAQWRQVADTTWLNSVYASSSNRIVTP